ncbi:MAG: hypothetical protein ACYTGH_04560 [Planctomycetota bacterium]|jgi:hypothetical protein
MEYKKRLLKKRKARQARNRKARGLVRVKVRGRKRWVATASAES